MKKFCFYLLFISLFVLSACAQKRPVSMPQSHLPPQSVPEIGGAVPDQNSVPDDSTVGGKGEDQNPLLSAVRPVQRPRPKALTRMIKNAENQLKNKQPQRAFSILEQALYIDGQDPLVWHLMAKAQYDQGNVVQAISLAKKSNSLAAAYPDVKAKNAALLRKAQGN
ncbi:tetratricopeptide repeat protein [uncultured Desulfobacter sp.]|uniref:tetratricopeptide repeat protein n=1 Tax=uncultured Desulfobacter sp. TaxID=240139 RepID=UPI0029F564A6|nr:tetratricopeptide repeat protein [uncultured Desulfobacter sp.]